MKIITCLSFANMTLRSLSTQVQHQKHCKVDVKTPLLL